MELSQLIHAGSMNGQTRWQLIKAYGAGECSFPAATSQSAPQLHFPLQVEHRGHKPGLGLAKRWVLEFSYKELEQNSNASGPALDGTQGAMT